MNYFQLYETQRNHLKVGAKWFEANLNRDMVEIEIISIFTEEDRFSFLYPKPKGVYVFFKYITGPFIAAGIGCWSKIDFLNKFKPYNEPTTHHELL